MNSQEFSEHFTSYTRQLDGAWVVAMHAFTVKPDAAVSLMLQNYSHPVVGILVNDFDLFGQLIDYFGPSGSIQSGGVYITRVWCTLTNSTLLEFWALRDGDQELQARIQALQQKFLPVQEEVA